MLPLSTRLVGHLGQSSRSIPGKRAALYTKKGQPLAILFLHETAFGQGYRAAITNNNVIKHTNIDAA